MIYYIILLSLFIAPHTTCGNQTVYIYAGPGTSANSLQHTLNAIEPFLKSHYQIEPIFPEQIIHDAWETKAALLIMPGGRDIPYCTELNGMGNQKIRSYVENGGSFLGICAGAYYAGEFVDFAKGTSLEVQGQRELSFFPGIVRGPVLAPYNYQNESGARAAKVIWRDLLGFEKSSAFTVYHNGGGYFVDAEKKEGINILASYDSGEEYAAIVECRVGSGKVILSGVHFEYDPHLLDAEDEYLQHIIPELNAQNLKRVQLIQHLLGRLNLCFNPSTD